MFFSRMAYTCPQLLLNTSWSIPAFHVYNTCSDVSCFWEWSNRTLLNYSPAENNFKPWHSVKGWRYWRTNRKRRSWRGVHNKEKAEDELSRVSSHLHGLQLEAKCNWCTAVKVVGRLVEKHKKQKPHSVQPGEPRCILNSREITKKKDLERTFPNSVHSYHWLLSQVFVV